MLNDNDLIRRGDLKDLLLKRSFFPAIVAAALQGIPKVDAVEVVRCKDCRYGELDEFDRDAYYLCHCLGCGWNDGNHYCSYGERKDDGKM